MRDEGVVHATRQESPSLSEAPDVLAALREQRLAGVRGCEGGPLLGHPPGSSGSSKGCVRLRRAPANSIQG